jgi:hypothetical protein
MKPGDFAIELKVKDRHFLDYELKLISRDDISANRATIIRVCYLLPDKFNPNIVKKVLNQNIRDLDFSDMFAHFKIKPKKERRQEN